MLVICVISCLYHGLGIAIVEHVDVDVDVVNV